MADTKQTTPPPAPEIIPTLTDVAVAGDLLGEDLPEFAAPPLPAGETPTQAAEPPVEAPSPPTPPPADKPVEIESLIAATVRKELQSTLESTVSRLNDRIRQLEAIIPRTLESSETEKTTSPPPDMGPSKQQPDPQPEPQTLEPAPLDKTYDPHTIELAWYQWWEEHGCFAPSGTGKAFCIMIPPPNVTGTLHMGHAFQDTLMDILIRYHRMQGDNTLWQVGTDHAGIATQMVVERQLAREGRSRRDLGREDFIQKVWEWRESSGGTITRQLRRMGTSVDWSRERFTLDEVLSEAVTEVFVRLYSEGLIYRGKRLVNWDPQLQTAVSDLEVIS
jgi:hypothetical protein